MSDPDWADPDVAADYIETLEARNAALANINLHLAGQLERRPVKKLEAQLAEARELLASATSVCGIDDEWWLPRRDALLKELSDA